MQHRDGSRWKFRWIRSTSYLLSRGKNRICPLKEIGKGERIFLFDHRCGRNISSLFQIIISKQHREICRHRNTPVSTTVRRIFSFYSNPLLSGFRGSNAASDLARNFQSTSTLIEAKIEFSREREKASVRALLYHDPIHLRAISIVRREKPRQDGGEELWAVFLGDRRWSAPPSPCCGHVNEPRGTTSLPLRALLPFFFLSLPVGGGGGGGESGEGSGLTCPATVTRLPVTPSNRAHGPRPRNRDFFFFFPSS